MSERFALILLAGALPLFFIGSYPAAFAYLAVYNAVAFGVLAWDRAQVPDRPLLTGSRERKQQWILNQPQRVVLQLTSDSGHPLTVDVRESLPAALVPSPEDPDQPVVNELDLSGAAEVALTALGVGLPGGATGSIENLPVRANRKVEPELPAVPDEEELPRDPPMPLPVPLGLAPRRLTFQPYASIRLSYALTPAVRGGIRLGKIHVRIHGPLGLAWREQEIDLHDEIDVVPQLPVTGKLGQVDRRPPPGDSGLIASRKKGTGFELESLRDYVPGDEFRKISWKATARRGRAVVKETIEEVSQQILVMLDHGRRMGIAVRDASPSDGPDAMLPAPRLLRLDLALDATLLLARAALQQGDRVGLWTFTDTVGHFIKPSRGHKQWVSIGRVLQRLSPSQTPTDYVAASAHLLTLVKRRSIVVILTEPPLAADVESLQKAIVMLHARHSVLVVALQDPDLGEYVRAAYGPLNDAIRRSAAADILAQRRAALGELSRLGVPVMDVEPADLTLGFIQRSLKLAGSA